MSFIAGLFVAVVGLPVAKADDHLFMASGENTGSAWVKALFTDGYSFTFKGSSNAVATVVDYLDDDCSMISSTLYSCSMIGQDGFMELPISDMVAVVDTYRISHTGSLPAGHEYNDFSGGGPHIVMALNPEDYDAVEAALYTDEDCITYFSSCSVGIDANGAV